MWDALVLTAGSAKQQRTFELQLERINWQKYARRVIVSVDPPGVRCGSGGATLHLLRTHPELKTQHVLLIHAGGLSQRTPHLSVMGKVFARLPSGKTILETKLDIYRPLPYVLSPGLLMSASDVIEFLVPTLPEEQPTADVVLFAHASSVEVARQHGVYVLKDNKLAKVLQKPSEDEMRENGAIDAEGNVLTDSAYYLSSRMVSRLASISVEIDCETCVYGDFLRPLGTQASASYIDETEDEKLRKSREAFARIFTGAAVEVWNSGPRSFFHFGTIVECLKHYEKGSDFHARFPEGAPWSKQVPFPSEEAGDVQQVQLGARCFVDSCSLAQGSVVGEDSIVYNVRTEQKVTVPNATVVFTLPVKNDEGVGYVTVVLGIDDDVKKKIDNVLWGGEATGKTGSLWDAPLFKVEDTPERSVATSLAEFSTRNEGVEKNNAVRISMANAIEAADVDKVFA